MTFSEKSSVAERVIAILADLPRRLGFLAPRSPRSLSFHQPWRSRGLSSTDLLAVALAPSLGAITAQHLTRNVQEGIKLSRLNPPAASVAEADYRTEILNLLSGFTPAHLKSIKYHRKTEAEARAFFWSHVRIGAPDDCWLWNGSTTPVGNRAGDVYGLTSLNGQPALAHRWAYQLAKGVIAEGLMVRHTCDTFLCCNPRHLITGTSQENMNDAVERGRIPRGADSSSSRHPESRPRGESCGTAKLTGIDILTMMLMYDAGIGPAPFLAWLFEVSEPLVNLILDRRSWSHFNNALTISRPRKVQLAVFYAKHVKRPGRKLDEKLVRELRLRAELGWSYARIAREFGLSQSHVSRLVRGETWSRVE